MGDSTSGVTSVPAVTEHREVGTGCLVLAGAPPVLLMGYTQLYFGAPVWVVIIAMAGAAGVMVGLCALHTRCRRPL